MAHPEGRAAAASRVRGVKRAYVQEQEPLLDAVGMAVDWVETDTVECRYPTAAASSSTRGLKGLHRSRLCARRRSRSTLVARLAVS